MHIHWGRSVDNVRVEVDPAQGGVKASSEADFARGGVKPSSEADLARGGA
jgi:hypothetical protein